jgi:hypothetical protein
MKRRSTFCKQVQTPDWKNFGANANTMLAAYDNSAALASASRSPHDLGNFRPKKPFAYRRSHNFRPAFLALAWLRRHKFPRKPISAANRPLLSQLHLNKEFVHKNGDFMHLRGQREMWPAGDVADSQKRDPHRRKREDYDCNGNMRTG